MPVCKAWEEEEEEEEKEEEEEEEGLLLLEMLVTDCWCLSELQQRQQKKGKEAKEKGDVLVSFNSDDLRRKRPVVVKASVVTLCVCGESDSGSACGEQKLIKLLHPSPFMTVLPLLSPPPPLPPPLPSQPSPTILAFSLPHSPQKLQLPPSSPPPPPPPPPPSLTTTFTTRPSHSTPPHSHSVKDKLPPFPLLGCGRGGGRGVWERWAWVVVVLAVLGAANECHAHYQEPSTLTPLCSPKNDSSQKICSGMDLRNDVEALAKLCHCSIIEGYLHFVLQEKNDIASATNLKKYTFPDLREITEHLLVYRVFSLTTLRTLFPNLTVIRGEVLFYNYALVIYDNPNLVEVGLTSLTSILRGSVRIERNPQLCHVTTVDWAHITSRHLTENYINRNMPESECRPCPAEMDCPAVTRCGPGRCWGPGACQILCRSGCPGGCVGGECCHEECVGGCLTPGNPMTCLACRNFWDVDEGRCSPDCPIGKLKVSKHRCEAVQTCPKARALRLDTRECVWQCPAGHENSTMSLCRPCQGQQCHRRCPGTNVSSVSHAQALRGCTIIEGSLAILINGGENVQKELEDNLSSIKAVEHYVKVFRSNITSLGFLSSLTRVGGHQRLHRDYAMVILDNPNLQELWNASGLTIERGKILVHANPKLCLHHVHTLANQTGLQGLSETDVSPTSNGDKVPCNITPLRANVSTSPLYGTLTVTVEATHFPGVSVYYVSYMKTDTNISLYDSDQPCSEQGWATVEMSIVNGTGKEGERNRGGGGGVIREETGGRRGDGRVISGTLVNLDPYTRYAVFVKTVSLDSSARGAQSEVMYATTSPYNPSEPENLQWSSPNSSTLKLWWLPPRHPNGVIDHYLITLVLLLDVPKIPVSLDFCKEQEIRHLKKNLHSDPVMRSMSYSDEDEIEEEDDDMMGEKNNHYDEKDEEEGWENDGRLLYRNDTRMDGDGQDGEYSCRRATHNTASSSSSCCACPESSSVESDGDVLGQIAFEDFMMDSVYVKKVGRGRRRARQRLHELDDFEKNLHATYQPPRNTIQTHHPKNLASRRSIDATEENTGIRSRPDDVVLEEHNHQPQQHEDGQGGDFPLYPEERVHEFPSQGGIRADYQLHEDNLQKYNDPLPKLGSVLRLQVRQTRSLHLTIHRLLHFSLYSISIVACQIPEPLLPNVWMKLCSLQPAQTAAYTKPRASEDQVPTGSLKVMMLNGTLNSVSLSWETPKSPNGGILAYVIRLHGPLQEERCVTHKHFEIQARRFDLNELHPGNYSVSIRIRSKANFGPYSEPVSFVIPDPAPKANLPSLGVILTVLLGVVGMVTVVFVFWGWRRYHTRYNIPSVMDRVDENPYYRGDGFAPSEMFREEFIFWRDDLKVMQNRPLGKGFFGMVFEGELTHGAKTRVAVKTHTERASKDDIQQFLKEAAVMQNISCYHVVRLLGVVADYSPVYVVMELMEQGDLKTFLQRHARHFVSEEKLVEMAVQAADGMTYLAKRRLVHRDLAARNCLLDDNLILKIGDFGLSRSLKSDYYRKEGQGVLPVKWMSPESLQQSVYSTHSDMWSYGVLLWEMATRGLTPYKNCTNEEVIHLVVDKYATLNRPRDSPPPFQRLMRRCWRYDPPERPSFLAVTKYLLKHTSAEFQERFEKVSFYHSRSNDYVRYRQVSKSGFMSGGGEDSGDEAMDDIALMSSSSEESDEEIVEESILRFRTPRGSPRIARKSPGKTRGEASTTFVGASGKGLCRVAGGVTGPSDWSRSVAPSVLHFYTNVNPNTRPLGQVVVHGDGDDERELRYAQLALSTPSTPASGDRTPLPTPGLTPHTPFLHPNTAGFPSPCSVGLSGSLLPNCNQHRRKNFNQSRSSSQSNLVTLSSAAKPSIPLYINLGRSLSTLVSRTSAHTQAESQRTLGTLIAGPQSRCGRNNTLTGFSKSLSFKEGRNFTLPWSTSASSIPTNDSNAAHTADPTLSGYSSLENVTCVPSTTSFHINEETASSSLSSILFEAPHSSHNSEHGDGEHTLSSLPQRTKSKFFRCERVYINTQPRASGSLPDNFFRTLHSEYTESSSSISPKSKSLKKYQKKHDHVDIEMK